MAEEKKVDRWKYISDYMKYATELRNIIDRYTLDPTLRQILYDRMIAPYYYYVQERLEEEKPEEEKAEREERITDKQMKYILNYISPEAEKERAKVAELSRKRASEIIGKIVELQRRKAGYDEIRLEILRML